MKSKISRQAADKVAAVVGEMLRERFKEQFVFGPIIVEPAIDPFDVDYLDIYIVYEGDYANLDTKWTGGLSIMLWPALDEVEVDSVPTISFVEKSEWEEVYHGKYPRLDEF